MRLPAEEQRADRTTLGEWLAGHGQGPAAVAALWDLIALPTLNLPAAEASLALGAFVFRTGMFSSTDAGDIGFHVGTLDQILGAPAARALARAGVEVHLGWRAERVLRGARGLLVRARGGGPPAGVEELAAERVIVALPPERAAALLEPLVGEPARTLRSLGASPIVNLHVLYDRVVFERRFAAGVGTPVQYLFDRTEAAGCRPLPVPRSLAVGGRARDEDERRGAPPRVPGGARALCFRAPAGAGSRPFS